MEGCFVAVPTNFNKDLSLNIDARKKRTKFLMDGGFREEFCPKMRVFMERIGVPDMQVEA